MKQTQKPALRRQKDEKKLMLYFRLPEDVNLEDRRYTYRKHLRSQGFDDDAAAIVVSKYDGHTILRVAALNPFLKVLNFLPYTLLEASLDGDVLTLEFLDNDTYNSRSVDVLDRDSTPARFLEALVYFAFEEYGVKEFKKKGDDRLIVTTEKYHTDYLSPYRTNAVGYTMITAILNGLGQNKYWLTEAYKQFDDSRKEVNG